jgi:acid phosphatase family membrane protein YuiD
LPLGSLAGSIIMDYSYLVCPFIAWLTAGCLKFSINSLTTKTPAFGLIGYGGLPSNHSAIVSSMATLIAFKEGLNHPAFGVALTLAFIVVLDAASLRKQVGRQAAALNRVSKAVNLSSDLRERVGHTLVEIIAGIAVGVAVALVISRI